MVGYGKHGVYLLYLSSGWVVFSRDITFEEHDEDVTPMVAERKEEGNKYSRTDPQTSEITSDTEEAQTPGEITGELMMTLPISLWATSHNLHSVN